MKRLVLLLSAACLVAGLAHAQNLLSNGDFNLPNSTAAPDGWSTWSYGGGWANHQLDGSSDDGSLYMACGGAGSAGGGVYQIVPGTEGFTYTLAVDGGAQAWWRPQGEMRIFFLDASSATLDSANPIVVWPGSNDTGLPWAHYTLSRTAPAGTTQVKVEFAMNGNDGGTVWFDNALLTAVPEPGTFGLVGVALAGWLGFQFRRRANRQ